MRQAIDRLEENEENKVAAAALARWTILSNGGRRSPTC